MFNEIFERREEISLDIANNFFTITSKIVFRYPTEGCN